MRKFSKKGFTLIELMIVVAIIGILAAIAIPNFIKFQQRAKQSEPKGNLKGWFTSQKAWYQENNAYGIGAASFVPERGNRYFYDFGGASVQNRSTEVSTNGNTGSFGVDVFKHGKGAVGGETGDTLPTIDGTITLKREGEGGADLTGDKGEVTAGSEGDFVGFAVGDIDNETGGLDTWVMSSQGGVMGANACIGPDAKLLNVPAGVPGNIWNDVNCDGE